MKRIILLVSVVIFCLALTVSPTTKMKTDPLFVELEAALPEGWKLSVGPDTLTIYNPAPIWVLQSNFINAPESDLRNDETNQKRIVEHGKKTTARFVFEIKLKKGLSKSDYEKTNYFSKNYALTELNAIGFDTPYERCYPWDLEEQASEIYNVTIGQILKKGIGPVYPDVDYSRP